MVKEQDTIFKIEGTIVLDQQMHQSIVGSVNSNLSPSSQCQPVRSATNQIGFLRLIGVTCCSRKFHKLTRDTFEKVVMVYVSQFHKIKFHNIASTVSPADQSISA